MEKQTETITTETELSPELEESLKQTTDRVQSIRATAASFLGVPPDKACDMLRSVWKTSKGQPELTDNDMFMGMSLIARYGLDPIAKEVYVTRTKGGLATIIGLDGWIKILDRTDHYDGFEVEFETDQKTGEVTSVETIIHSTKRSHPTRYKAFRKEYETQGGFVSGSMPLHMLRIFSLRHAARLFAPVGGSVVTEDEARWMDVYERDETPVNGTNRIDEIPPKEEKKPVKKRKPKKQTPDYLVGLDDALAACDEFEKFAEVITSREEICKNELERQDLTDRVQVAMKAFKAVVNS